MIDIMNGASQNNPSGKLVSLAIIVGLLTFATAAGADDPTFFGLGDLPGGGVFSSANGVSADGTTVIGSSISELSGSYREAFRWTAATGMVPLGDLPSGRFNSIAEGVSADGSVVVGTSDIENGVIVGFVWTEAEGMTALPLLAPSRPYAEARDVSADGSIIVGISNYETVTGGTQTMAVKWTEGQITPLGMLPDHVSSIVSGMSADGRVVYGKSYGKFGGVYSICRWVDGNDAEAMPELGNPYGVSTDGTFVVGIISLTDDVEAYRWSQETGVIRLENLNEKHLDTRGHAVSADGSIVVGRVWEVGAFIWDEVNGMRDLKAVLEEDHGLDMTGWSLNTATDISDDGTVIVGHGVNPLGDVEAWVAVIPEPATLAMLALGGLALLRRKRK